MYWLLNYLSIYLSIYLSKGRTTGSTETLLIKLELHFEEFSFNLVSRVLPYPPHEAREGG